MMAYLILVLGWTVYLALHSLLAMPSVKERFRFRGYRLAYILFAGAGLLVLLFYNGGIDAPHFFVSRGIPRYVSLMLTTFGVMIIQSSFRQYSFRGFIGLEKEPPKLVTEGVLKYVRHPIYAGTILIIVGFFLFIPNLPTLISCACMLVYIPIGILLEERKLVNAYGEAYIEYRKRVPAVFPKLG